AAGWAGGTVGRRAASSICWRSRRDPPRAVRTDTHPALASVLVPGAPALATYPTRHHYFAGLQRRAEQGNCSSLCTTRCSVAWLGGAAVDGNGLVTGSARRELLIDSVAVTS